MFGGIKNVFRSVSIVLALLSCFAFHNLKAQGQIIDSLKIVLSNDNLHDTSKVSILNRISIEYIRIDLEKSLHYAQKADSLSISIDFPYGKAESLRNIGTYYLRKSNFSVALEKFVMATQIFEQIKNIEGKANCLISMGATYSQSGDYELALEYYQQSLNLWLSMADKHKERIAAIYNNMGIVYRIQGNYPKALEHYQNSLLLKEQIGDKAGMSDTYINLGVIFRIQQDYDKALEYYFKSLEIRQEIGYTQGVAMIYNNIGIAFGEMGDYASALEYYMESLNIRKGIDDKIGVSHIYNNIGDAYFNTNELLLSQEFYEKGLKIAIEIGRKPTQAYCLIGLGKIMLKQEKYQEAYRYSKQAFVLADQIGDITIIGIVSEALSQASAALGLYKKAYELHVLHKSMSDSIHNQANTKKIIGLEYEYKYQRDRVEQEKRDIEQQARFIRQKQMTFIFIVGFILTLALVVIVLLSFRRKQRDFKIISDQKRLLQEQAIKLKELDEMKSRFFTNISHEFRTPLTLILGPAEQLINKTNDPKTKSTLKLIQSNAQNLMGLITQLLDIAKIEKGMVKMKFCHDDICKEISFTTKMFASQAATKGVELEFSPCSKEINGYYDKDKVERILFNLISNAIKNTEQGKISISLKKAERNGWINLAVADTGRGIEKEKIPYIFDRFYMANETGTMGTGIGLAFTNELVKVYKGSISVESELGKGTTFSILLPITIDVFSEDEYEIAEIDAEKTAHGIATDEKSYAKEETEVAIDKSLENILLVEDHEELRKFIASNLSDSYNLLEAENGKIGIEKALETLPDLIITDVMMPEVNGIELAKTLKNNENTSHIPIIMLTAKASEQSKLEGLETQVDDYLTKPFSIRELAARIKNILAIRQKLREKYKQSLSVNPSEITSNSIDEQFVARILKVVEENMADPEFSVEVLCEKAGVGRSTLHNKLKSLLNQSATEFINTIRVKRAAQLIKQNSGTISEIAYDVGFNNLSYFTKVFKKHMGVNPSEIID